jgi:hypothetical protein
MEKAAAYMQVRCRNRTLATLTEQQPTDNNRLIVALIPSWTLVGSLFLCIAR